MKAMVFGRILGTPMICTETRIGYSFKRNFCRVSTAATLAGEGGGSGAAMHRFTRVHPAYVYLLFFVRGGGFGDVLVWFLFFLRMFAFFGSPYRAVCVLLAFFLIAFFCGSEPNITKHGHTKAPAKTCFFIIGTFKRGAGF